nr:stage III sporulation protein AB [Oscillospiraceae bacterium]
ILGIILDCAGTGMDTAYNIKNQVRHYQKLLPLLEDCAIYIRYQNLPLQELFSILEENPDYQDFNFLKKLKLSPEFSPEIIWHEAIQESNLPSQAKQILQNLGHELGKTDTQGQLAVIALYQTQMQTACEQCRSGCEKKSKLYQSLGWLGGAMLAILFI